MILRDLMLPGNQSLLFWFLLGIILIYTHISEHTNHFVTKRSASHSAIFTFRAWDVCFYQQRCNETLQFSAVIFLVTCLKHAWWFFRFIYLYRKGGKTKFTKSNTETVLTNASDYGIMVWYGYGIIIKIKQLWAMAKPLFGTPPPTSYCKILWRSVIWKFIVTSGNVQHMWQLILLL